MDNKTTDKFDFKAEIRLVPDGPGIYIFRDKDDTVIYVGRAVNLRNRLRSYFQPSSTGEKATDRMKVTQIQVTAKRFEYIITENLLEALILECNLIKEYMPRYNVRLKDDKNFPYICLSLADDFPRVTMARKAMKDGNKYFGPFVSSYFVSEVVTVANTLWPLRVCTKRISADVARNARPCLNYHISKCPAPCGGHIGKDEYRTNISEIRDFLSGKRSDIAKKLENDMAAASEAMEYEKAARLRDKVIALRRLDEKQSADTISTGDHDVIALAHDGETALVQVFFIRAGKMTGHEHYIMAGLSIEYPATDHTDYTDSKIMQAFITQFYSSAAAVPKELNVSVMPEDDSIIAEWLTKQAGRKITINAPERGDRKRLCDLAKKNAAQTLAQFGEKYKREEERTKGAAAEIAEMLGLEIELNRIEAFDISNVQGYENVASMTVFEKGKPKRGDYRKFKLRTFKGANDYAAIEEAVTRRFQRYFTELEDGAAIEDGKFTMLPDIVFVDGGIGQINVAIKVLEKFGLNIPVCGMVKDNRHRTRGLIFQGSEFNPPKNGEAFRLITRIQDETHRFAVEYHRKLREKTMLRSVLDDIPGVGPTRRKALLKFFGSTEGIEAADVETLMKVNEINKPVAQKIYDFFRKENSAEDIKSN
ncbi:MAG: excinuclease ABC subunit UvrC [Defluviitaleaceae bacterium]|nr:excinuclease ABC subunit UvrC [Defluviitaleaceae bacterium]